MNKQMFSLSKKDQLHKKFLSLHFDISEKSKQVQPFYSVIPFEERLQKTNHNDFFHRLKTLFTLIQSFSH